MNARIVKKRDERGASLMLVIAFMVLMGAIAAAVISTATSGIQERVTLDQARNRQYAADAATEMSVAAARGSGGTCPAPTTFPPLNSVTIHVDCSSTPAFIVGPDNLPKLQKDLTFVASCVGASCPPSPTVISARVNFQGTAPAVTTFVQAWSVNG